MDMNMLDVKDRVTQYSDLYKLVPVDPSQNLYQLVQVPGTVTEEGTPINRGLFESIRTDLRVPSTVLGYAVSITYDEVRRERESGGTKSVYCTSSNVSSNTPGVTSTQIVVPDNCNHVLVTFLASGEASSFASAKFYVTANREKKHTMLKQRQATFSSGYAVYWADSSLVNVTPGDTVELLAELSGNSSTIMVLDSILMQVLFLR